MISPQDRASILYDKLVSDLRIQTEILKAEVNCSDIHIRNHQEITRATIKQIKNEIGEIETYYPDIKKL